MTIKKIEIMSKYDDGVLGVENPMHPANQKEIEEPQVTINESWYDELYENRQTLKEVKKLFKEWYALNSFPLKKSSDEKLRLAKLENELIDKLI